MSKRRTDQEWQTLILEYENSTLTLKEFCKQHRLACSTFSAKRSLIKRAEGNAESGFVRAQVVESTTEYHFAKPVPANMTLSFNEVELSIPQGTPPEYLANLMRALQS
ncbi:transposase [Photobacterium proteolyticum]|uniref:Transposase n=1 Tax=Photobacterium proteolyticum TaxID=1903952 RepID=A0A1Q9H7F8_9GAMM|nr:hypothetical protein [Photobacterium proteolyticum]OLQ83798.1 transposase [Photobacterium proteolyticum]